MDNLVKLLIFSFSTFGLSFILVFSSLLKPFRDYLGTLKNKIYSKLINCILCVGFHSGWLFGILVWSPCLNFLECNSLIALLFDGCLGSAVSWLIFLLIKDRMSGL